MGLIERRIGLLFAGILVLLVFAAGRTAWLGVVKGSALSQRASAQQVPQDVVPAPRGTITDSRGVELAVSEPAGDVAADPLIIKNPLRVAQQVGAAVGPVDRRRAAEAVGARPGLRLPRARSCPRRGRAGSSGCTSRGSR